MLLLSTRLTSFCSFFYNLFFTVSYDLQFKFFASFFHPRHRNILGTFLCHPVVYFTFARCPLSKHFLLYLSYSEIHQGLFCSKAKNVDKYYLFQCCSFLFYGFNRLFVTTKHQYFYKIKIQYRIYVLHPWPTQAAVACYLRI